VTPSRYDGPFPEHRPRRPGTGPWRAKGRRPFGETWWAKAWIEALEHRARLDSNRLPRGRTYARTGAVGEMRLSPGQITAPVQGSRATPYRVTIVISQFSAAEWERVLESLAAEIGHVAALVDGELPPSIADDVRSVGLDLLPGPGDLNCHCSCPDWAEPCKHAAAVCYLVADSLDTDPFGILLLRGRSRKEILQALRARRSAPGNGPGEPDGEDGSASDTSARGSHRSGSRNLRSAHGQEPRDRAARGRTARDLWAAAAKASVVDPPPALPAPRRAGRPTVLAADPPAGSGVDLESIADLAADAAERAVVAARAFVTGSAAEVGALELGAELDIARRAARRIANLDDSAGRRALVELAARSKTTPQSLFARAVAWSKAGADGVVALEESWSPEAALMQEGIERLGPRATLWRNRVTLEGRQLRLGKDRCWYPFRKGPGSSWLLDGEPFAAALEGGTESDPTN
jgi:uncharacterized Zn finger protein